MFWNPYGIGGVNRVIRSKRAHFSRTGWRHTLVAPGANGEGEVDCGGVLIPGSGGYRFVLKRAHAATLIESRGPQIIESADPYVLGWAALDAGMRLQVPTVAFCHSNLPAVVGRLLEGGATDWTAQWASARAKNYLTRLYERYDAVFAPSQTMVQQLKAWGIKRAQHQPLGVDCSVFSPTMKSPAWARYLKTFLGLQPSTKLLLYYGRFAPEKRLDLVVQAVERLGAGYALIALGAGPCPPTGSRSYVLPAETNDSRLAKIIASCDVFVHAGDQETFGLAALEAMACGTPVVVSRQGGLGELAVGAGYTVGSRKTVDWADAIAAALENESDDQRIQALRRARSMDWTAVLDLLAERYLVLAGCGTPK